MSAVGIEAGDFLAGRSGILKIPWKVEYGKNNCHWQQSPALGKYTCYEVNKTKKQKQKNPTKKKIA